MKIELKTNLPDAINYCELRMVFYLFIFSFLRAIPKAIL